MLLTKTAESLKALSAKIDTLYVNLLQSYNRNTEDATTE